MTVRAAIVRGLCHSSVDPAERSPVPAPNQGAPGPLAARCPCSSPHLSGQQYGIACQVTFWFRYVLPQVFPICPFIYKPVRALVSRFFRANCLSDKFVGTMYTSEAQENNTHAHTHTPHTTHTTPTPYRAIGHTRTPMHIHVYTQ